MRVHLMGGPKDGQVVDISAVGKYVVPIVQPYKAMHYEGKPETPAARQNMEDAWMADPNRGGVKQGTYDIRLFHCPCNYPGVHHTEYIGVWRG